MSEESSNSSTPPSAPPANESEKITKIEPIRMPTIEEVKGQDIWNNCFVRSTASGIMGGGLGLAMGLLLGALDSPPDQATMTGRQLFLDAAKKMGNKSWTSCKTFALMGLVFSAAECVVEKGRAKHDITNTVAAGCVTGGSLAIKGGTKAVCFGCAGFAAFSAAIEKFLERHE